MTDALLRALERRWRETRTIDDEVRYLLERVRVGQLHERGLIIAAGLGHEASARIAPAIGLDALELVQTPESLSPANAASSPRARSAVALAREMGRRYTELLGSRPGSAPEGVMAGADRVRVCGLALDSANDWVSCPCERHASALVSFGQVPSNDCIPECCWDPEDYPGQVLAFALNTVAECADVEFRCRTWFTSISEMLADTREHAGWVVLAAAAHEAISAELLPWALELGDPLSERVQGRSSTR